MAAKEETKKHMFISYKREVDITNFVNQLKRDLEANGFSVWLDMESISSGSDWHSAIGTGLQECAGIIPIITPSYIDSRYCMNELYAADGDKKLIFPIMYEDVDLASTEGGRALKFIVSGINWTMFRPGKDSYDDSFGKLVKGMKERVKEEAQKAKKEEIQKAKEAEEEAVVLSVGPSSSKPLKVISGIESPTHLATGRNGEIVVASYMSHKVHVYDQDGQLLRNIGSNGFVDGQFMCPGGIAVDRQNRVYVSSMCKVDIFTMEGQFVSAVGQQGNGPLQFTNASAIAVAKDGVIYVTDTRNNRIQVINRDLTYRTSFSDASKDLGSGRLNQPQAIAVNSEGNLYVADTMNHAVQVFTPDGKFLFKFGKYGPTTTPGAMCTPMAIAIDQKDNVYVSSATGTIGIFDKEGSFRRQFGSYGSELGQFSQVKGMHVDRRGRLYVSEWISNRIQIFPGSPSMEELEEESSTVIEDPKSVDDIKPAYLVGPTSTQPHKIIDIKEAGGVAVGKNGEVAVASYSNHKVFVYDSKNDYRQIAEVGGEGDQDGKFQYPADIAITSENYILVSSCYKLQWFTMEGDFVHAVGGHINETLNLDTISTIAVGKNGNVYILDSSNRRVLILNGDTTFNSCLELSPLASDDDDDDDSPTNLSALAVSSENKLYITDTKINCVHVLSSSGESLFKFGKSGAWMERGALCSPMAIATDAEDNVFVGSVMMVSIFDKTGSFIRVFGGPGSDPGQFLLVKGLHIDRRGYIYVSEYNNNRVQIFEGSEPSKSSTDDTDAISEPIVTLSSRKPIVTLSSRKPAYMIGPTATSPVKVLSDIKDVSGIAEGKNGEVVVASQGENKVFVYSSKDDYQLTVEIGGKGELDGKFIGPYSVAITSDNLILVSSQHKLQWFTMEGKLVYAVGGKGTDRMKFDHPTGIAVDKDGLIYVIDKQNKRVVILNGDGTYRGCFRFSHITNQKDEPPCDVAINSEGNLYLADSKNNCVHVLSSGGEPLFKFGKSGSWTERGSLHSPSAIAIDTEDNVFVGDQSKVSIFDKSGSFIKGFDGSESDPGQFSRIRGLCIGREGHLYVSEYGNNRVQIFKGKQPSGEASAPAKSIKTLSSRRPAYTIGPTSDQPVKVISGVVEPWGVATTLDGSELFVVSKKEKKVLIYSSPEYELKAEIDKIHWETSRDAEIADPRGIAVRKDGYLLLNLKNRLVLFNVNGEGLSFIGKKGRRGKKHDELDSPNGIAMSQAGQVYVVDSGNKRVEILDDNLSYRDTGYLPEELERSADLEKVAVNSQGNVYVTDKKNDCIHVFATWGKFLFSFGTKGGSSDRGAISSPTAIAIDHEDYIYISCSYDGVSIFDREGRFVRAFGSRGAEPGQFKDIKAMHIDIKGNLFICEKGNNRVQIFSGIKIKEQGEKDRVAFLAHEEAKLDVVSTAKDLQSDTENIGGITEGKNGEIIMTSCSAHEVFMADHNCNFLRRFGDKGDLDGQFNHPTSVVVTPDDYILVSSRDKLQWFTVQGQLVYAVGSSGKEKAEFNHPDAMATGNDNRIYVLEKQNKRIQILNGNGTYHSSFSLKADQLPEALAVNSKGIIFCVNTRSSCIAMFSSDGNYLSKFNNMGSKELALPTSIAIDTDDCVYVGTADGIVAVFDETGGFVRAFRGSGNASGQFSVIRALYVGQSGRIYIYDFSSERIKILGEAKAFSPNGADSPASPPGKILPYRPTFTVGPKSLMPVRILSGIQQPAGVATGPNGDIFIASNRDNKILIFGNAEHQPPSEIKEIQNPRDPKNKRISNPSGLAFAGDGYLLVSFEHQLVKMTLDGTAVAFFGNEKNRRGKKEDELNNPGGIAVGRDGKIYLVDRGNHRIQIFQSDLTYSSSLFNPEDRERSSEYVEYAALNSAGDLYVTDRKHSNVQVFNHSGKFLFTFGKSGTRSQYKRGQLSSPRGIAVDREDFVYVGDDNGIVTIFDKKGNFVRSFGGSGDQPGQFKEIHGMHIDSSGQLYVCDFRNNRVQVFSGQY